MADPHTSQPLSTLHADLITSLAFSHSAPSLLASTSLDGWIRIHGRTQGTRHQAGDGNISNGTNGHQDTRMVEHDGSGQDGSDEDGWTEVGGIKANEGPVWRAIWGPREYGTTLLVSIAGSVVHIWETRLRGIEQEKLDLVLRATLVEARGSLRDIAFAPSEFGLKLVSIAADSHLRVYECLDASSAGLATWSLVEDIDLSQLPNGYLSSANSASVASHAQQFSSQTQLIKGFDDQRAQQPGTSRASSVSLAGATSSTSTATSGGIGRGVGRIESSGAWAVAYCQEAWWGECVAVSAGRDGSIRLLAFASPSHWAQVAVLSPPSTSQGGVASGLSGSSPVSTLAWAPSCGRSYHLVAAGSRDGSVRIWKVVPPVAGNPTASVWESNLAAEITEHVDGSSGGVGRVEWNLTGTVLSTAGCDGVVRLWKASYSGEWRCLTNITVDSEEPKSGRPSRR